MTTAIERLPWKGERECELSMLSISRISPRSQRFPAEARWYDKPISSMISGSIRELSPKNVFVDNGSSSGYFKRRRFRAPNGSMACTLKKKA